MKYSFHPLAKKELNEAIVYYLGIEFAIEVYKAIQVILQFPQAWSQCRKTHDVV